MMNGDEIVRPQYELLFLEETLLCVLDLGEERDDDVGELTENPKGPALGLEVAFEVGLVDHLIPQKKFQLMPEERPEVLVDEVVGCVLLGEMREPAAQERRRIFAFGLVPSR